MTQLTDKMIINSFNTSTPFFKLELIAIGIFLLIIGIIYFFKYKKEKTTSRKKDIIIVIFIVFLVIGIELFENLLKYNAIIYSIENNSWYVETDTVERKKSSTNDRGNTSYYVYLTNRGKVSVNMKKYYSLSKGNTVYVVIVKGRFGKTYTTSQIYSTREYTYNK